MALHRPLKGSLTALVTPFKGLQRAWFAGDPLWGYASSSWGNAPNPRGAAHALSP